MYFDTDHLSMTGSWRLEEEWIKKQGVPFLFTKKDMPADGNGKASR